jgi:hypothetical protein
MDDRLAGIEERLEQLVPRGLSDTGAVAIEATIDQLAERAARPDSRRGWWRGFGAAAAVAAAAGLVILMNGGDGPNEMSAPIAAVSATSETVVTALQVQGRFDGGWVVGDGSQVPYRYHGFELTDEREMLDRQTGYRVQVREHREEWIPVKMTSL